MKACHCERHSTNGKIDLTYSGDQDYFITSLIIAAYSILWDLLALYHTVTGHFSQNLA